MATKHNLNLHFGAICFPLQKQLNDQGLVADKGFVGRWQKSADAIARLNVQGLLADSEAHRARQRLIKEMTKLVRRLAL